MSTLWDRMTDAGPATVVLIASTLALLALPVLRRLAPRDRRQRGGPARLFLGLAVLLAVGAVALGTMGAASPGNVLQLAGLLALMLGLVGVAGVVVFDVVLCRLRIEVPSIVRDLLLVAIAVSIAMGFLRLAGLDVFSLVTTSAVLTAVVGLALQSTIANVFSGLGLQLDRTLRHGEWIEVGNHVGRILEIGWRSTRIQTKDGDTVFVPNSELVSKDVRNFTGATGAHRMTVRIGFHYRHPPHEVRRVLLAAIRDVPGVAKRPAPECGPSEFGESAVVYSLRYWITDFAHDTVVDEEVHARIWYAARRAGLEIPFPTRTVVTEDATESARAATREQEEEQALRRVERAEPFSRLSDDIRRACTRGARRLEFVRGEHLLQPDEPEGSLYLIESGEVRVQLRSPDTSRHVTLRAHDLLGRTIVSQDAECTALSEVVLYRIDPCALRDSLAANADLGAALSAMAAARHAALDTRATPSVHASGRDDDPAMQRVLRIRRLLGR